MLSSAAGIVLLQVSSCVTTLSNTLLTSFPRHVSHVRPCPLHLSRAEASASGRGSGLSKLATFSCAHGVVTTIVAWTLSVYLTLATEVGTLHLHCSGGSGTSTRLSAPPIVSNSSLLTSRSYGSFGQASQELLHRVVQRYCLHAQVGDWEAHDWIYCRISFTIMHDVAE